jgi:hypothetical protein
LNEEISNKSSNSNFEILSLLVLSELHLNGNLIINVPSISPSFFLPSLIRMNLSENNMISLPPLFNFHPLQTLKKSFNNIDILRKILLD